MESFIEEHLTMKDMKDMKKQGRRICTDEHGLSGWTQMVEHNGGY